MNRMSSGIVSICAALILLAAAPGRAAEIVLEWDPASDPRVAGHVVYWGTESGRYTESSRDRGHEIGAGETRYTATDLPADAPIYFVVTSVDAAGRIGPFSNEAARPRIGIPEPDFVEGFGPCGCATVSGLAATKSRVEIFANGIAVGETRADDGGRWRVSVDLTPAGEGRISLVARSTGADSPTVFGWSEARTVVVPGDLDGDGETGLADAILALQATTGHSPCGLSPICEATGDGRIGLSDAIFLLQRTAGLR